MIRHITNINGYSEGGAYLHIIGQIPAPNFSRAGGRGIIQESILQFEILEVRLVLLLFNLLEFDCFTERNIRVFILEFSFKRA